MRKEERRLSKFRLRGSEGSNVHESLALSTTEDDVLVITEGDSPNGVTGLGKLANEGASLEVCSKRRWLSVCESRAKESSATHPIA